MWKQLFIICLVTIVVLMAEDNSKVLSRQRRYLIFPTGASFQLGIYMEDNLIYICNLKISSARSLRSNHTRRRLYEPFYLWRDHCTCLAAARQTV